MFATTNIMYRVFRIKHTHGYGTGTVVEIDGRQFLLTAHHVVNSAPIGTNISLDGPAGQFETRILRRLHRSDLALVEIELKFPFETFEINFARYGMAMGEDVLLAGFPAGEGRHVNITSGSLWKGLNPFLRKGIISNGTGTELIIDTLVQKGFSGGPVFIGATPAARTPALIAVITGGLLFPDDKVLLDDDQGVTIRSGFTTCLNAGLAYELAHDELGLSVPVGPLQLGRN